MDTLDLDHTEDLVINTTHRYNQYCHLVSEDGTKRCSLYSPHEGLCKPQHGTENDRFKGVQPAELKAEECAIFNLLAQERLIAQLRASALWEGMDVVAGRLGIEVSELESRLDEANFTLTELRLLAIACEIGISYEVNLGSYFR